MLCAALGITLSTALSSAWTQPIVDPENVPSGGNIVDPENVPSGGNIVDPENPGTAVQPDVSSGAISDPENTAATAPAPPRLATPSSGIPMAIFSGGFSSSAAFDTRREDALEDTLDFHQELEMRVRVRLSDRWRAVVEGRLGWRLTAGGDPDDPAWLPDGDSVQGRVTPELRDFYVSGRAGRWLMRFGNQSIAWGSTDISKPADVINPIDLRRGVTGAREDIRVPIPALDLIHAWDKVAWEFVLVPFFVPHKVDVFGSDMAPVSGTALTLPVIPGFEDLRLIDPSLEELIQPLLLQTELPEETPRNLSAGTRLTLIRGGWDVSLGYFYGWDRVPLTRFHPAGQALVDAVINEGGTFFNDAATRPEIPNALQALTDGETLFSSTYERLHTVTFDGVTYAGPIGIRFETAINPERTTYTASLRGIRRASVSSALGLSYERSDGNIVASGEVFHVFFAQRPGDERLLYDLQSVFGVAGGLQLGFGAFPNAAATRWERFGIQLAGIYLPNGRDLVASPSLTYDANDLLTLSAGASIYASFGDEQTIGDLLTRNNAVFLRLERAF